MMEALVDHGLALDCACPRTRGASRRLRLGMAMAGRLMARLKRGRGHSPAASGVYLVGRHLRRPRRYRRSQRAGCALSRRAVSMTAESTARLHLHPAQLRLMQIYPVTVPVLYYAGNYNCTVPETVPVTIPLTVQVVIALYCKAFKVDSHKLYDHIVRTHPRMYS